MELLERGTLRRAVIASAVVLAVIVVITKLFNADLSALSRIDPIVFILTLALLTGVLLVKALKFYVGVRLIREDDEVAFKELMRVRLASEFLSLISVSYVGDEAFRIAWMSLRGYEPDRAFFIAYVEVLGEVIVASILALLAAISIFPENEPMGTLIAVSVLVTVSFHSSAIMAAKLGLGSRIRIGEGRIRKLVHWAFEYLSGLRLAADSLTGKGRAFKVLSLNVLLSTLSAVLSSLSFFLVASSMMSNITLVDSLLSLYSALALSSLPVTIGGAGIMEVTMGYFLTTVRPGCDPWSSVLSWRLLSFYYPLLLCGLFFSSLSLSSLRGTGELHRG